MMHLIKYLLRKSQIYTKKGQVLFHQGGLSNGIFCLKSGKVKISKIGRAGKETILDIAGPGGVLAHQQLFSGDTCIATATVIEEAKICFIEKKSINEAIEKNPLIALNVIRRLSKEINIVYERNAAMSHKNLRERLAELLLMLKESYGQL
jgi:CRP-like cAMP-binding protein